MKNANILKTDKGNYFVNYQNLYFGFFSQDGHLLRTASEKEWRWAIGNMIPAEPEINLNINALLEIYSSQRQEALKQLVNFTGKSIAQKILNYFGLEAQALSIKGQMSPKWEDMAVTERGELYNHEEWLRCWAVADEIVEIDNILIQQNAGRNGSGSSADGYGFTADYLARTTEAEYLVIKRGHDYVTEHGSRNEVDCSNEWLIFKRPNMNPVWEEWREMADNHLNNFFRDNKNISEKDYPRLRGVVRSFVSDEEIPEMIIGTIDSDWSVAGVSSSGEMYSDRNEYKVYGVNHNVRIFPLKAIQMVTDEERENMADYEPTPFGYNWSYIKKQAPGALFFIMKEEHERWAERQPSESSRCWHLLRPISRKEIMIRKINAENSKVMTFADLMR